MNPASTALCRLLGLRHPVIQGPFGGGLSTVQLAATVAAGGGLGSFGAHQLAPDELGPLVGELRAACRGPFAVNLWVSTADPASSNPPAPAPVLSAACTELGLPAPALPVEAPAIPDFSLQLAALIAARPPVISWVFGIPSAAQLAACRTGGIRTIGTATTVEEAIALDAAGVDVIVASGSDAGGHRAAFIRPAEDSLVGTMALIPQVVDRVRAPVVAAGGIADERGVRAALVLGAAGVQVGTAFLACDESGASALQRAILHSPAAQHTRLTRLFTGRLARVVANRLTDREPSRTLPYPYQSWATAPLQNAASAAGRVDLMRCWSGQAAGLVHVTSAARLLASLATAVD